MNTRCGCPVTVRPPFAGLPRLQESVTHGTSWTRSLHFANLLLASPPCVPLSRRHKRRT
jgi:hypothetical protein